MLPGSGPGVTASPAAASGAYERVAAVLLCVALPLLFFVPTVRSMVDVWDRSETFAHCFLVFPAFAYLVWSTRAELRSCPVRPAPVGLLLVLGAALLWALGELSAALAPSFFGIITLSIATVITVLGVRIARAIWVPLLFLYFAVPFGEVFVPTLVDWTADFTVAAIAASGVPVYREGPNFVVPTGNWSVVDACSGIRYLLATMFAGWLYAWLMFRSPTRRLVFMGVSIIVPIVANWLRAYMIVMLGHLSENRLATGVDHLIYGWIFFGVVILLLFWVGAFFREDVVQGSPGTAALAAPPAPVNWLSIVPAAAAVAVTLFGMQLFVARQAALVDSRPVRIEALTSQAGWKAIDEAGSNVWQPRLRAPSATRLQHFEKDGQRVAVFIGVFRNQSQDSELVNTLNDVLHTVQADWKQIVETAPVVDVGGRQVRVNRAKGKQAGRTLVIWQWNWVGGRLTASDAWSKAMLAIDRLLGRGDTSAWLAVYGIDNEDGSHAEAAVRQFVTDMGTPLTDALRRTVDQ